MRRRLAFGLALGAGTVLACQLLAGIDDRTVWDGGTPPGDSGVDPCNAVDLPPAPTAPPPDTNPITITAALSQVMFGATDGGPYYGFNLDKTCTCPDIESCVPAPDAGSHCDDDGGIDNYARRAFEKINAVSGAFGDAGGLITETKLNAALTSGLSGALIEVSKYNGQADDGQVTVTIYASQGFEGYPTPPAFDGSDHWIVDPSSASGQYYTDNAYVVGYTLVATGLNFPIVIGSATTQPVTVQLDEGIIEAKLDMNGNQLKSISGVLGGRWNPAKFLPSLQSVPDPYFGGYLCGSDPVYGVVKGIICESTDINVSSAGDRSGPCNSVSMGLGFQALPAMKGSVGTFVDAGQPCGANWKDSCSN